MKRKSATLFAAFLTASLSTTADSETYVPDDVRDLEALAYEEAWLRLDIDEFSEEQGDLVGDLARDLLFGHALSVPVVQVTTSIVGQATVGFRLEFRPARDAIDDWWTGVARDQLLEAYSLEPLN